jgi:hypothetical protein
MSDATETQSGGSLEPVGSAFHRREMVPGVGSPRWEAMSEESHARWREIHATPCIYCGRPISEQFWMMTWPDGRRAHEACLDDSIEAERSVANNPFEIDRAARAAKMTVEGFKLLPSWERFRLIRETQNDQAHT